MSATTISMAGGLVRRGLRLGCLALLALGALGSVAPVAAASAPHPGFQVTERSLPTHLAPGGNGVILLYVYNVGAAASTSVATLTDVLPAGLTAEGSAEVEGFTSEVNGECSGTPVVTCKVHPLAIGGYESIGVKVKVEEHPPAELSLSHVTVAGGGALGVAGTAAQLILSPGEPAFGVAGVDGWFSNADGTLDTQAGSHPYQLTLSLDLNVAKEESEGLDGTKPAGGEPQNVEVRLPPGLVGNPNATPQCTRAQFDNQTCPASTQIGITRSGAVDIEKLELYEGLYFLPVFNLVPPPGIPSQFGFELAGNQVFIDAGVRSGSDYGITVHANNLPQNRDIVSNQVTIWGVPADASHDAQRVPCFVEGGMCPTAAAPKPLLTLPTSCAGPQTFSLKVTAWEGAGTADASFHSHDGQGQPTGLGGCDFLGFGGSSVVAADTAAADTPAGLTAEVKVPQEGLESAEGLSTSDIQNTTVVLPSGFVINPGQAAGLQACAPSEDGLAPLPSGEEDNGPPHCPNASRVGTVTIKTPLLEGAAEKELQGNVYVLQSNPPELKLLVAASADGVNVKLVGVVHLDEQTGQLTTKFDGTPELPFTDFKLSFSGGAQAALDTPTQCGTYTTTTDFTPWSTPLVADFNTSSSFAVTAGPGGGPCPASPLPFAPTLVAGSTTDQAGGFTNFSLLLQRGDGQQRIERLRFKAPAGLGGMLSTVPLCGEPQAGRGECSPASQIGHASVASGPGPYPLVLPQPGAPEIPIYLTGGYGGAPFGLSIVTHVIAGPFDLGTIVTRAQIEVDPHTAQITVTTDPLPQVVAGVPTDLRLINAVIDRPGFMFNPTNCSPSSFSGTAWGAPPPGADGPGASAPIASRFQVGSCRSLEFAPKFSVTTSGHTSKANGASLTAKVSYPNVPQGTQADIGSVKVELPKQLPSRLTTLQKACTLAQFEANPAGCPSASFIGHAVVHTPELPVALTGPAIFVSHGGEAFPTLTMVLQGDGVTIDLVGSTFISKKGVTSTTFKTVPDAPFSTFELTLPEGKFSALTALGNLCTEKLTMPTEFVAQNGALLKQSTKVAVTGCAKKKSLTRAQKLAAALRACHKDKNHGKRTACEHRAHRKYGQAKTGKRKK